MQLTDYQYVPKTIVKRNYITPAAQVISLASEENVLLTMSVSGEVGGNIGSNHRNHFNDEWEFDDMNE